MKERMVTVYKRKDGKIYLHGYQKSSIGVYLACPPFVKIEPSDISKLPQVISDLIILETETVPHPKTFNQLEPLYEIADCRGWSDFAKGALCFHVKYEKEEVKLVRTNKDRSGFANVSDPILIGDISKLNSIFSVVPELV